MRQVWVIGVAAVTAACGCQSGTPPAAPPAVAAVDPKASEPSAVELSDPTFTFEASTRLVRMELRYKFTSGVPSKYYSLLVTFPGTENRGLKLMDGWELKPEGVLKDGFVMTAPPVKAFEVTMSEATSPQDGYKPISNTLTGEVR